MSGRLLFGTFTCTEECDAQEKKAEVNANPVERERFDTCDGNLKIILFTLKLLNKNVLQGVNLISCFFIQRCFVLTVWASIFLVTGNC